MNTTQEEQPVGYAVATAPESRSSEERIAENMCGGTTTTAPITATATRRIMLAGGLGLVAAALIVASPELGVGAMIGGAVAGSGSALATLFARR
jgi:hypothetical protein